MTIEETRKIKKKTKPPFNSFITQMTQASQLDMVAWWKWYQQACVPNESASEGFVWANVLLKSTLKQKKVCYFINGAYQVNNN